MNKVHVLLSSFVIQSMTNQTPRYLQSPWLPWSGKGEPCDWWTGAAGAEFTVVALVDGRTVATGRGLLAGAG